MSNHSDDHAAIRHYSALRFAMLSVFVAITALLLNAQFSTELTANSVIVTLPLTSHQPHLINLVGVWVSVVFAVFEIALNCYLHGLWSQIPLADPKPLYRRGYIVWPVRIAAFSLPVGAIFMWCII